MAVLLLAEIAGGALALDATAKAVTAAKSLGDVTVLVAGPAAAGEAASKIDGVAKVLVADDAAYATVKLENGIIAQINSDWCTRVNRDDLVTFQVDGTKGSAVATLASCKVQSLADTPRPVWNPDEKQTHRFQDDWQEVDADLKATNGFRIQWEQFLRHVVADEPWHHGLEKGAESVQLAEIALASDASRSWQPVPPLATLAPVAELV